MKILIISDAWMPQVNGVVRTLTSTIAELEKMGHHVSIISPDQFPSLPCPTYPEIRLAIPLKIKLLSRIGRLKPDAVHIATEGPLGVYARIILAARQIPFTSSFATKFPEYIENRFRIASKITYRLLKWFHAKSKTVMVATPTVQRELEDKGFKRISIWGKGVDKSVFYPQNKNSYPDRRPILLYAGRVAVEKNLDAFLSLSIEGTKYVVGDGPLLAGLEKKYPAVRFVGIKHGRELAQYYAAADVFVFPSLTDTFGLVMIEALACGVPVAAYPVTGPIDVIAGSDVGVLSWDLKHAIEQALIIDPKKCVAFAENFSWEQSAQSFLKNLYLLEKP